jgi:hypothetical protein
MRERRFENKSFLCPKMIKTPTNGKIKNPVFQLPFDSLHRLRGRVGVGVLDSFPTSKISKILIAAYDC